MRVHFPMQMMIIHISICNSHTRPPIQEYSQSEERASSETKWPTQATVIILGIILEKVYSCSGNLKTTVRLKKSNKPRDGAPHAVRISGSKLAK